MSLSSRALPLLATLALGLSVIACAQGGGAAPQQPATGTVDVALGRSLQDNVWTLQSGTEASGQPIAGLMVPGQAFVLRFDATRVAVSGGCNSMSGSWQIDGQGQLVVGRVVSTMKGCEQPLMQADRALAAVLAQPLAVKLEPGAAPRLSLASPARQALLLSGQPTMESRYGAPTRVFLEVAPQTVACQPGAGAPTQCLRVRDRRFDDKGLRIDPPGEWRIFYGSIEGYTHTPGVSNVLRLKRYQRSNVPADASAFIYVLDLVVESASAKP